MTRPPIPQRAPLDDAALGEALAQAASFGRLSDTDVRAMREMRRRKAGLGVTAALALMVGVGVWHDGDLAPGAPVTTHYETGRGQRLNVELADGSRLQLDGATSVDVTLGKDQRRAALRHGEAYFDIAHEPARPFTVDAGGAITRVLGTAFDIDLSHRDVRLAVYRGAVRFGRDGGAQGVTVPAGWRSRFSDGLPGAPTRFDAGQQDWRQDWLDTDDMRLGDLVDRLNRRGGPVILPPPPALADLMLTGRFKLNGSEPLLAAIGSIYGFTLVHQGADLRLVPTADSDAKVSSP
jgi:transmembrane sensor